MKHLPLCLAVLFSLICGVMAVSQDTPAVPEVKPAPPAFVMMNTSKGEVLLELNAAKAPISVANFLRYVKDDFYDGTIFHRVINGFMVQGGGFTTDMTKKETGAPIKNEWDNGLKNKVGTIAMARTRVPDSATSQFFINVADNGFLDQARDGAAYAVFGKVAKGMDVVDAIRGVKTDVRDGMRDVPVEPVVIISMKEVTAKEAQAFTKGPEPTKVD